MKERKRKELKQHAHNNKISSDPISRRDIFRLAGTFGWTSLFLAASSMYAPMTLTALAQGAEYISRERSTGQSGYAKKPRKTLTYAITISGKTLFQINGFGYLEFIRDIEARTDGEIRIEFIPGGEICDEMTCVKKVMQGIVDIYSSSIQNAAGFAEYFNVLNFPYLFPTRAAQHHFFYHPESQRLLRDPLTKHHGLLLLFNHCRLRGVAMGAKWQDKSDIKTIDELAGAKIRVTASKFGNMALKLLGMDTVPLDWNATLNALKLGLIDGMETWESAAAGMSFEEPNIISQFIDLALFSGNTHAAIRSSVFDSLTPDLQAAMMESAYFTQIWGQLAGEASLINMVGASNPHMPGTIFGEQHIRYIRLPENETRRVEQMCSPQFNPKPWEDSRDKLNKMAGNIDIYNKIFHIAREIPPETLAENVIPRRWWKG